MLHDIVYCHITVLECRLCIMGLCHGMVVVQLIEHFCFLLLLPPGTNTITTESDMATKPVEARDLKSPTPRQ